MTIKIRGKADYYIIVQDAKTLEKRQTSIDVEDSKENIDSILNYIIKLINNDTQKNTALR